MQMCTTQGRCTTTASRMTPSLCRNGLVTWRRWLKVVNKLVKIAEGLPFAAICSRWNTYIGFRCSLLVWAVVVSNPTRWTLSIIFGPVYGSSISSGGPQVNREISAAMYWSSSLLDRNVWLLPNWRSVSTSCRNCFQLKHISVFKYDDEKISSTM